MPLLDAVKIALFLDRETVILQHRDKDAPTNPNKLTFFGGSIEPSDSTPHDAAVREIREETDLKFSDDALQYVNSYPRLNGGTMYLFRLAVSDTSFTVHEGQGLAIMKLLDAYQSLLITSGTKMAINYLCKAKENVNVSTN